MKTRTGKNIKRPSISFDEVRALVLLQLKGKGSIQVAREISEAVKDDRILRVAYEVQFELVDVIAQNLVSPASKELVSPSSLAQLSVSVAQRNKHLFLGSHVTVGSAQLFCQRMAYALARFMAHLCAERNAHAAFWRKVCVINSVARRHRISCTKALLMVRAASDEIAKKLYPTKRSFITRRRLLANKIKHACSKRFFRNVINPLLCSVQHKKQKQVLRKEADNTFWPRLRSNIRHANENMMTLTVGEATRIYA